MKILSVNVAEPRPDTAGADRVTGIDKRPVPRLSVFAPGPDYGDGSGAVGDVIGDVQHHGGAQKAVYAFAAEKLEWWSRELGREFAPGSFGENLTTTGCDFTEVLINQRFRAGTAELEVSVPRTPCKTFAAWVGVDGWQKRFAASGDCGAYFRVAVPGEIGQGDAFEPLDRPDHGITMGMVFRAKMGDQELARTVWEAQVLPPLFQERLDRRFG